MSLKQLDFTEVEYPLDSNSQVEEKYEVLPFKVEKPAVEMPSFRPNNSYYGGKGGSGTYQQIINKIRPHDCYFEPFAGGASVFKYKKLALYTLLNDLDGQAVNLLKGYLLAMGAKVIREGENETTFLYEGRKIDVWQKDYKEVFNKILQIRLQQPLLKVSVYIDPPYLLATRKEKRLRYRHELADAKSHTELLKNVKKLPCDVLISSYENHLYNTYLGGNNWTSHSFTSTTRNGSATEILYRNYIAINELHDYQYLGNDYREREALNNVSKRWLERLKEMDVLMQGKIREKFEEYFLTK